MQRPRAGWRLDRTLSTTEVIIAFNVLIYGLMLASAGMEELGQFSTGTLVRSGALYAPLVGDGQVWRLLTAAFIHLNPIHILMNMVALFQVGHILEPHYGRRRYVVLYLVSALGASALSLAVHWVDPVVAAGASGAISGLIGAGAMVGHLSGTEGGRRFRNSMLSWMGLTFLFGFYVHADNVAHLGGLLAGAGLAWVLARGGVGRYGPHTESEGLGVETALLVLLVAVSFGLAASARGDSVTAGDLINQGVTAARAGDYAAATPLFRRAATMEPRDAIAHFDLAISLVQQKQYAEAEQAARTATELEPKKAEAYNVLADALDGQGKEDEAAAARRRYQELGGSNPQD
ncbi:MAG TPA: rhomboid family intramembrane serine protease [Chloroflexia bacterium]|nr:rhomboid family intramembrane serine protease [Chloroflexia bacterium]